MALGNLKCVKVKYSYEMWFLKTEKFELYVKPFQGLYKSKNSLNQFYEISLIDIICFYLSKAEPTVTYNVIITNIFEL